MGIEVRELPAEKLRRVCDLSEMDFSSTAELSELTEIIGQERATRAVEFGIDIPCYGYNMYALGPAGAGKTTTIQTFLERKASTRPTPDDWCCVNNLQDEYRPQAIHLPPGKGREFQQDMDELLENVSEEIPRVFESQDYEEHRNRIVRELRERRAAEFERLEEYNRERGFALLQTPRGLLIAPVVEGQVLTPEQYEQLTPEQRQALDEHRPILQERLDKTLRDVRELEREGRGRLRNLDKEIASFTIGHFFAALQERYAEFEEVLGFLKAVEEDIIARVDLFKGLAASQPEGQADITRMLAPRRTERSPFDRYRMNVIVDNFNLRGAPVVVETNPTYMNLLGRIEHRAEFGTLVTDFSMIRAGSLHRANGGYLVVDARSILRTPLAWDALKRALRHRQIRIEEMSRQLSMIATVGMEPEPIPLDVKVVLIGDPMSYYLLYSLDEEFQKLFKVRADFATEMDWTPENVHRYARFIRARCREDAIPDFDPSAVAKVVEYGARLVENQKKLSTRFAHIADVAREAAYWGRKDDKDLVTAKDVQRAIEEKVYRSNQLEERIREFIEEGTIMVDTEGEALGQVNGLSIVSLGDYAFGHPSRITARTFMGQDGVINIEREAKLSGAIHDKGVLILSGYLGSKYAQDKPLSLSASLCFEQSYSGVEGDSASSTELYALLSSLSGLSLKQGIAVTGSVNQEGEIQAVGGVIKKIEGFYDVCKVKGLTGEQGVILPHQNVHNLMLREDVVEAVREGEFHIWPVTTVDEGISILTGVAAGERQPDGKYPAGTVNYLVNKRLTELAEGLRRFARQEEEKEAPEEEESETEEPKGPPGPPPAGY